MGQKGKSKAGSRANLAMDLDHIQHESHWDTSTCASITRNLLMEFNFHFRGPEACFLFLENDSRGMKNGSTDVMGGMVERVGK